MNYPHVDVGELKKAVEGIGAGAGGERGGVGSRELRTESTRARPSSPDPSPASGRARSLSDSNSDRRYREEVRESACVNVRTAR